jgi:uncharacterized DUF497 family protein
MTPELDITWDAAKARSNLDKHQGISFTQAATVLLDPLALTEFDSEHSDYEERWFTLGRSEDGRLLAVSHTYRPTNPTTVQVRIISARKATPRERKQYENNP